MPPVSSDNRENLLAGLEGRLPHPSLPLEVLGVTRLESLYLSTATLLIVHQIDSAYWQEWKLFGMSGEIQSFVVSNVPLVLVFLYGLIRLVKAPRVGARFGLALAVVGTAAFFIHGWFLLQGRPEFRVPASVTILSVALVTSLGLGWQSVKTLRTPEGA